MKLLMWESTHAKEVIIKMIVIQHITRFLEVYQAKAIIVLSKEIEFILWIRSFEYMFVII